MVSRPSSQRPRWWSPPLPGVTSTTSPVRVPPPTLFDSTVIRSPFCASIRNLLENGIPPVVARQRRPSIGVLSDCLGPSAPQNDRGIARRLNGGKHDVERASWQPVDAQTVRIKPNREHRSAQTTA